MYALSLLSLAILVAADKRDHSSGHTSQANQLTGCHFHGDTQYCVDQDGNEGSIVPSPDQGNASSTYTGCHTHDNHTFCESSNGAEVEFVTVDGEGHDHHNSSHAHSSTSTSSAGGFKQTVPPVLGVLMGVVAAIV